LTDTPETSPSILDWLTARNFQGLPGNLRTLTDDYGHTCLHHPDGCLHGAGRDRRPVLRAQGQPAVCACVLRDALGTADRDELAVAVDTIAALRRQEETLADALQADRFARTAEFPAFTALAVRHHRWYAGRTVNGTGPRRQDDPAIARLRAAVATLWDAAEAEHPLDEEELRENAVRYVVREATWRRVIREARAIGCGLDVHNGLMAMLTRWFSRPMTGTLAQEYYSPESESFRRTVAQVRNRAFGFDVIDGIDDFVRRLVTNRETVTCHVGSPDLHPFSTEQGPRSLLVWHGLRVRGDNVAFATYPEPVAAWLADSGTERGRGFAITATGGGIVVPVAPGVDLAPHQWETAMALWEDSFDRNEDDPGPYRDQRTAILAAADL